MINRLIALVLLIMLSPFFILWLFYCLLLKEDQFYTIKRVGHNFTTFNLFKYRTMNIDDKGPLITVENDFRITKIGKYLRKFKIDEFPQILNIILGDLNLLAQGQKLKNTLTKMILNF